MVELERGGPPCSKREVGLRNFRAPRLQVGIVVGRYEFAFLFSTLPFCGSLVCCRHFVFYATSKRAGRYFEEHLLAPNVK